MMVGITFQEFQHFHCAQAGMPEGKGICAAGDLPVAELTWKRYSKVMGCPGSITGPAACCVRPVSLYPSYGLSIGR